MNSEFRITSFFQLLIKTLKTFAATLQKFLVAQSTSGPALEHLVDANTFGPLKLPVFQVSVVNHFGDFPHGPIGNSESLDQRFESAVIAMMREFHVGHIEGQSLGKF